MLREPDIHAESNKSCNANKCRQQETHEDSECPKDLHNVPTLQEDRLRTKNSKKSVANVLMVHKIHNPFVLMEIARDSSLVCPSDKVFVSLNLTSNSLKNQK